MKKQFLPTIFRGFSLAEALITLLIVCLITLASVPVLTKKKRDLKTNSGMWICTRKLDGTYVYWQRGVTGGDINNPETWVSANADSCAFTPPLNSKNFVVTLIGGGGGGADGVSERKDFLNEEKQSFTPSVNDEYHLFVVGGGGGGAGCQEQADANEYSGGGGAGGYYYGRVKLFANNNYTSVIGGGGDAIGAQWKEHSRAASAGGASAFKMNGTDLVYASGGGGGITLNCNNRKCWGGGGGVGGYVESSTTFQNLNEKQVYFAGTGNSGAPYNGGNGTTLSKDSSGLDSNYTYGSGGHGAHRVKDGGAKGSSGHVRLWQINQYGGLGGEAAVPLVLPLPSLRNNKLKAYIGEGGINGENGGQTTIKIFDKSNKELQKHSANGGIAGTKGTDLNPTQGQNSLWNNKGGGAVAKCEPAKDATYDYRTVKGTRPVTDSDGNVVCEYNVRDVGGYYPYSTPGYNYLHMCDVDGICIGYQRSPFEGATESSTSYLRYLTCSDKLNILFNKDNTQISSLVSALDPCKTPQRYYMNYPQGMINSNENELCAKEKKEPYEYEELYMVQGYTPATCKDSANGAYFGAGGGGGPASDTLGVSGKGGKGAFGAVIIEW